MTRERRQWAHRDLADATTLQDWRDGEPSFSLLRREGAGTRDAWKTFYSEIRLQRALPNLMENSTYTGGPSFVACAGARPENSLGIDGAGLRVRRRARAAWGGLYDDVA
jgi:hypothetical protein